MAEFSLATICMVFFGMMFLLLILLSNIKQIDQYEKGIIFTRGKFKGIWGPGWHVLIPVFQKLIKVDIRTKTIDLTDQEAITQDNVSTRISAVLYYKINDASKAILQVENFGWATSQLAETTMRSVVGEVALNEILSHRDKVANRIQEIVAKTADDWGIEIVSVELKDVVLPEDMKRTMAKQAEAEREKTAVITKAEGERIAADNLAAAAKKLSLSPGALHLRTLNALNDISSDQSNTLVFALPIEVLRAIEGMSAYLGHRNNEKDTNKKVDNVSINV